MCVCMCGCVKECKKRKFEKDRFVICLLTVCYTSVDYKSRRLLQT